MLRIDKAAAQTTFVVTITENTTNGSGGFRLELTSAVSQQRHQFDLPANTSNHKARFDRFTYDTSTFDDLSAGQYSYSIKQKADGKQLECGLLEVIDHAMDEQFISIPVEAESDYIKVYKS